jgi:hypothetical protein
MDITVVEHSRTHDRIDDVVAYVYIYTLTMSAHRSAE